MSMAFHRGRPQRRRRYWQRHVASPWCRPARRHQVFVVLIQAATLGAADVVYGRPVSIGSDGSRDHSFHEPK
jgi:hypothetical protein